MEEIIIDQDKFIKIYPNPVKDKFIISFVGEQESVLDIVLFDSQGNSIL